MKKVTFILMAAIMAVVCYAQKPQQVVRLNPTTPVGKAMPQMQFSSRTMNKATSMRVPRKATEDYPIITEAPEGTLKTYMRSGDDWYASSGSAYQGTQSGTVDIVFADNNEVYILNPVCGYNRGSYVKGTLSEDGTTITIPLFQNLAYSSNYDAGIAIAMGNTSGQTFAPDKETTEVTYTIDGETITLNGTSEDHILSCFWTDDDSWTGYGEWNTVLTEYTPNLTPVTLPDGLEAVDMPMTGTYFASLSDYNNSISETINATVKVAKSDNTFYIQGLIQLMPEAWVMGELGEDGTIEIPVTYLGENEAGHVYAMGYSSTGTAPISLVYDAENGTMEVDGYAMTSSSELENTLDAIYTALFIGERPALVEVPEGIETVDMPLSATYYDGTSIDITGTVKVGLDTETGDVYVQGLIQEAPEGWIKGTFNDDLTQVIFPYGQYVGVGQYGSIYAVGDQETEEGDYEIGDFVLNYDSDKNVFISENVLYANGKKDKIYYYSMLANIVIGDNCDEMWIAAEQEYEDAQDVTEFTIGEDVTVTLALGTNSQNAVPKYYDTGEALRMYAGNTLTINSTKDISKIVFTLTGKQNQINLSADRGEYTLKGFEGTWKGNDSEIVFTVPSGSQARIQSIKIFFLDYTTTAVEVPENLETAPYSFKGTDTYYNEEATFEVQVGFDGNNVYFQGLSQYVPEAWVMGKLVDGKVTIPNWYLGVYESFFGDYEMVFSGAEFTYDAEADVFTSEEGYQTIADGSYAMDEYANVTLTKINEVAATPADPSVVRFRLLETSYPNVYFNIPVEDVDGNPLLADKLSYVVMIVDADDVEQPLTLAADLYDYLDEDMTEIPYNFTDNYDIYAGANPLYLNQDPELIASWKKIGVQSIYRGAGEEHKSNIGWFDIQEYIVTTGINTVNSETKKAVIYNLQGQKLNSKPAAGLYIMNGKKYVVK